MYKARNLVLWLIFVFVSVVLGQSTTSNVMQLAIPNNKLFRSSCQPNLVGCTQNNLSSTIGLANFQIPENFLQDYGYRIPKPCVCKGPTTSPHLIYISNQIAQVSQLKNFDFTMPFDLRTTPDEGVFRLGETDIEMHYQGEIKLDSSSPWLGDNSYFVVYRGQTPTNNPYFEFFRIVR